MILDYVINADISFYSRLACLLAHSDFNKFLNNPNNLALE